MGKKNGIARESKDMDSHVQCKAGNLASHVGISEWVSFSYTVWIFNSWNIGNVNNFLSSEESFSPLLIEPFEFSSSQRLVR